jgi:hypothetical protein
MKDDIQVTVALDAGDAAAARQLFERIGRSDLIRSHYPVPYSFALDSLAEVALTLSEWKALGLGGPEPFVRWDRTYAEAELDSAPLLHLIVRRPAKGYGGPKYGTTYDFSAACPKCGSAARQVSPLKVKPSELAKDGLVAATLTGEILLSDELVHRFNQARVSGVQLWPVESVQAGRSAPWTQLVVETTMPPLSIQTEGIVRERPCDGCGRDGYFQAGSHPEVLRYEGADLDLPGLPDIVETYELFGNSVLRQPVSASHFARPLILVKPSVYQLLKDVPGTDFIPVELHK